MSARELDAAGISDPALRSAYETCRRLNAAHGKTYYLSTLLLPAWKRPSVHALYGFARWADEVVDDLTSTLDAAEKLAQLTVSEHPVAIALRDTVQRWDIPWQHVEDFLTSMRMDVTVTSYATWDDLMVYVHGSAAVIGLEMLPVLGTVVPQEVAAPYAADLGIAFQLSNFLRDVAEDLQRGRVYLPQEDLDRFGTDLSVADGAFRQLMAFEVARTREIYRSATAGVRLLSPDSRPCVETALSLYGGILDRIEAVDYDVLRGRVSVGLPSRVAVAGPGLVRAWSARRRPQKTHQESVWSTSENPNSRSSKGA